MEQNGWHFWVDRGGTFTDVVAKKPSGAIAVMKFLSVNPAQYEDAALHAIRSFLSVPADQPIPVDAIASIKMGTTVATNALLERKGARTAFVATKGFADALFIGYQNRPDLFALNIERPSMLYESVIEADERIGAHGETVAQLNTDALARDLEKAFAAGITSCAICFMHAFRFPAHELAAAKIAGQIGFQQISISSAVSPLMKYVARGDTTLIDAYLSPELTRYTSKIRAALSGDEKDARKLYFMRSSGGLTDAAHFDGKDAILSGPAGGVVGMVETARAAGFEKIIGFDMGGTSTDVSHFAGDYERTFDGQVAGVRIRTQMMVIHTVAAGGGSILSYDGLRMRVGPQSAGAEPGPACYRNGGPLTVTDANVLVGKIRPDFFPAVFGPNGDEQIDRQAVAAQFAPLAAELHMSPEAAADGFLDIAVNNMAEAIKKISVQRGYDVSKYALCCFGGAGAQHACRVADALGMTSIYIHPLGSVLSAYGMGLADIRAAAQKAVEAELDETLYAELREFFEELDNKSRQEVADQGVAPANIQIERRVFIKPAGTDTPVELAFSTLEEMRRDFATVYKRQFGITSIDETLVVETIQSEAIGRDPDAAADFTKAAETSSAEFAPHETTNIYSGGKWRDAALVPADNLTAGARIPGPAILYDENSTIIVEDGWRAEPTDNGSIVMVRETHLKRAAPIGANADPVMLEIFNNLFMSIAEQMGFTLEKTASTVNIKERLDFSCALFSAGGALVANAPHMPVHLGSMSTSVRTVIERNPDMARGDAYALNDPYNGGTHLPDITIVAPVFIGDADAPVFYVAARGHHADIGGITPGSMPANSKTIEDEGVLIDNLKIIDDGIFQEAEIRRVLGKGPYPARNPDRNIADIRAQIAACNKGAQEIASMVEQFGLEMVQNYMRHVQDNAEECVRRVIDALHDSTFQTTTDQGAIIKVEIRVNRVARSVEIDFTGSSAEQATNFNAPSAVVRAAVLYVFRCMVGDDIPMNEGCLKPIDLIIPEGSMLSPRHPAATVAGNVETSQVITDALFASLGALASAQGTMNNLTFGNDQHQYYETICGGAGAGAKFDGASAVQTHMTNSRLTDPEVLEWRYPVRLQEFKVRTGSGGKGAHTGGDGTIRALEFLESMTVSLLTGRRETDPFGLDGGEPGARGENFLVKGDAASALAGVDTVEAKPHDVLIIKTPGGGGFGKAPV